MRHSPNFATVGPVGFVWLLDLPPTTGARSIGGEPLLDTNKMKHMTTAQSAGSARVVLFPFSPFLQTNDTTGAAAFVALCHFEFFQGVKR